MKKVIVMLTLLTMTVTSFSKTLSVYVNEPAMSEKLAQKIVAALRRNSSEEYVKLLPTLNEFHSLMDQNAALYGNTLPEAKAEFSSQYSEKVIPMVKAGFNKIIVDGKAKGIDWNSVEIAGVEIAGAKPGAEGSIIISLRSNGKEFKIQVEHVFLFEREWKAGSEFHFI